MRAILSVTLVTAAIAGVIVVISSTVYGVSAQFGWGFLAGGLCFGAPAMAGMYFAMKDQLARQRAELSSPERFSDL